MKIQQEAMRRHAKKIQRQIQDRATLLAVSYYLIDDERTMLEQYQTLKKTARTHLDHLASDYVNVVEANELYSVGELFAEIEYMIKNNIEFANRVLSLK